ncbi:entericidin A/B family lipoprotein [uncultured Legionella sp.]|nr:entericidin A/B family lipoprotein [uncultured Legionella sp.]
MKKIILTTFLFSVVLMLNACGTVNGIGKDVSKAGQEIQKAAR